MSAVSQLRRRDEGFTVVELLVGISVSLVVLLATLQSLDLFTSSASHQTRVTDANDQVRTVMDRTVVDLRSASKIVLAEASNLMYAVPETGGTVRTERICVASSDSGLYGFTTTAATTPAAPYPSCDTGTKLAQLQSAANTTFSYDGLESSATPALVKNVGLTFSLEATANGKVASSTLRASAARRSAGTLPLTDGDLEVDCGDGEALLSLDLGAELLEELGPLTVEYAVNGSVSIGSGTVPTLVALPPEITSIVATVTNAVGVTNTIEKDVECD